LALDENKKRGRARFFCGSFVLREIFCGDSQIFKNAGQSFAFERFASVIRNCRLPAIFIAPPNFMTAFGFSGAVETKFFSDSGNLLIVCRGKFGY